MRQVLALFGLFTCASLAVSPPASAGVMFMGLGDLAGGSFESRAVRVSADGSVVVGFSNSASGTEAFRWTSDGGMVGLGDLPGGSFYSVAFGVSANGSVIAGWSDSALGTEAFRWEDLNDNGLVDPDEKLDLRPEFGLGDLGGGSFDSGANGVSADGSVVAGWSDSVSGAEAFHWTSGGGMAGLGDPPEGSFHSVAFDVSANGSVVAGWSDSALGTEAFRWEDLNDNGLVDPGEKLDLRPEFALGDLDGGSFDSGANGVSADGSVVVGESFSASGLEAFRWTSGGGMVGLGDLAGGSFSSTAYDASANGSVVVGRGNSASGNEAFLWDATNGMQELDQVLIDLGLDPNDLTGWTLTHAYGISNDGRTIVGYGTNPSGYNEAWIAILPAPIPALRPTGLIALASLLFALGLVGLAAGRRRFAESASAVGQRPPRVRRGSR